MTKQKHTPTPPTAPEDLGAGISQVPAVAGGPTYTGPELGGTGDKVTTRVGLPPAPGSAGSAENPLPPSELQKATERFGHFAADAPDPISIGRIVTYTLLERDAAEINRNRSEWAAKHKGNPASEGDKLPMIVVSVHGRDCCNGQVFCDGNDRLWVLSRNSGTGPGQWAYNR